MSNKPILDLQEFEKQHRELDRKLKSHMISGRGRHLFDDALVERLLDSAALQMYAVSIRARIEVARALNQSFLQVQPARTRDFAFLTFTPKQFARPLSEAGGFDHRRLQDWTRGRLRNFHFIGFVEAALYTNANALPGTTGPMVSWHVHAIVWGKNLHNLDALRDRMNVMLDPLLPGRAAAHIRYLTSRAAAKRMFYMSKAPVDEYRVGPKKGEIVDPETGELKFGALKEFRQWKRPLRPGDAAKIIKVLGNRTITDLAFSSGDGDRIFPMAIYLARSRIRSQDALHRRKLRTLLGQQGRRQPVLRYAG